MACRCETVCQYQPPAPSVATTSTAAPASIRVRGVGRVSLSMPSSYAKSAAILTATGAAALPALRGPSHQVSAVRAPLKREPAEDQADPGREPHAHHQSGVQQARASELDEDGAILDGHRKTRHPDRGIVGVGAGRDVPAPGVPGTRNEPALEIALAERSTPMGAGVVDRV